MLALPRLLTIILLLILVMGKFMSPVLALIVAPIVTARMGGFTAEILTFITDGIKTISTTAVRFIFATLFFGVLMDAGTFDPVISGLLKIAGNDPLRITVVTSILATIVYLDGLGAVTFLVTISALLPICMMMCSA